MSTRKMWVAKLITLSSSEKKGKKTPINQLSQYCPWQKGEENVRKTEAGKGKSFTGGANKNEKKICLLNMY